MSNHSPSQKSQESQFRQLRLKKNICGAIFMFHKTSFDKNSFLRTTTVGAQNFEPFQQGFRDKCFLLTYVNAVLGEYAGLH